MYKEYKPKSILNVNKACDGGWFWNKYSAFPYKGCEWGCSYCYLREEKYNPHKNIATETVTLEDPFSQCIEIKLGAPDLLRKALKNKPKDLIYIDSYQAAEQKYQYIHEMLKVCRDMEFPVFINEKSPQVLNDLDILIEIAKQNYANVGWSIVFGSDNSIKKTFEPNSPSIKSRFAAMKKLSDNGILTGTVLMPVLPYICDNEKNLESIFEQTKWAGGRYVLYGGLTLFGYSKTFFYKYLKKYDPELITLYDRLYSSSSEMASYTRATYGKILKLCKEYSLSPFVERPVNFYPAELQVNKNIAGKLFLNSRHLSLTAGDKYKQLAYSKAAKTIDELNEDLRKIYSKGGKEALLELPGVGKVIADKIVELMQNEATPSDLVITRLSKASWFKLKSKDKIIYFDPGFTGYLENQGIPMHELEEKADLILISHCHKDHLQQDAVKRIMTDDTVIVAPAKCADRIDHEFTIVKPGDSVDANGIKVIALEAYNTKEGHSTRKVHHKGDSVGYLLYVDGRCIYFAGDTDYISEMGKLENVDIAFLPIGGTFVMDIEEAVKAVLVINPKITFPMHQAKNSLDTFAKEVSLKSNSKVVILDVGGKAYE